MGSLSSTVQRRARASFYVIVIASMIFSQFGSSGIPRTFADEGDTEPFDVESCHSVLGGFGEPSLDSRCLGVSIEPLADKVDICHWTPGEGGKYLSLSVDDDATYGGHGDHENDLIPAPEEGCPEPEPDPVKIVAHKIVCENETYLPNWGDDGVPDITESTAEDFVDASDGHCWLAPDWDFQWGFGEKERVENAMLGALVTTAFVGVIVCFCVDFIAP